MSSRPSPQGLAQRRPPSPQGERHLTRFHGAFASASRYRDAMARAVAQQQDSDNHPLSCPPLPSWLLASNTIQNTAGNQRDMGPNGANQRHLDFRFAPLARPVSLSTAGSPC